MTARDATAASGERRSFGFVMGVALANAGGVIAFLPLLTLLLPIKVEIMAGEARLVVLSATVIAGAVAASLANILFGWLSDRSVARSGGRRGWVAFGLASVGASYAAVALANGAAAIVAAIVLFQVAVNALLAPLFAIMAEEVPDAQKGLSGGLLALGNPLASGVSTLILVLAVHETGQALALVFVAVALCVLPLLAMAARPVVPAARAIAQTVRSRRDLTIAWVARLVVQVAGIVPMIYLYYYFGSVMPGAPRHALAVWTGGLLTVAFVITLPIAVIAGRWSDGSGRRKPFLVCAGMIAAAGLATMALATTRNAAAAGFVTYSIGWSAFLVLHTGFAMQLLPDPRHRGRDLGVLNLTNTLPSLLGPALTWWLATPHDFGVLLATLAGLAAAGTLLMLAVRGQR